jgi:hypothetical protein
MTEPTTPATAQARPCATCPYRRTVPSGIWHPDEYVKLCRYDGDTSGQDVATFHCHRDPDDLCAGWLGHRDPVDLLAVRLGILRGTIDPAMIDYRTDVELFASGTEAAEHGLTDIETPGQLARDAMIKLLRQRRMCSPMPDIDPDDDDAPGPCGRWPGCEREGDPVCTWPACVDSPGALTSV